MRIHQELVELEPGGAGFSDLTPLIAAVAERADVRMGLCTVFVQHTSASLLIQENADPAVLRDLERWMSDIAPEERGWEHDEEGPDDMPAHARSALTRSSETIPIREGRLALGAWQALYLWEHRQAPRSRRLVVHVVGE